MMHTGMSLGYGSLKTISLEQLLLWANSLCSAFVYKAVPLISKLLTACNLQLNMCFEDGFSFVLMPTIHTIPKGCSVANSS